MYKKQRNLETDNFQYFDYATVVFVDSSNTRFRYFPPRIETSNAVVVYWFLCDGNFDI